MECHLEDYRNDPSFSSSFKIIQNENTFSFKGEDDEELDDWVKKINDAIANAHLYKDDLEYHK